MGGCRIALSGALASYVWDGFVRAGPGSSAHASLRDLGTKVTASVFSFPLKWRQ